MIKVFCDACGVETMSFAVAIDAPEQTLTLSIANLCHRCKAIKAEIDVDELIRREILRRRQDDKDIL